LRLCDEPGDGPSPTVVRAANWQDEAVRPRVLVVEDDDGIRTALALALDDEGYDVDAHASGEDALAAVQATAPDLMLVDLMLGRMNGFTFIRSARHVTDAPVIVLSARDDTHDIVAALEAGADDYVTKPFVVKEVTARLRALMRRGRVAVAGEQPSGRRVVLRSGSPTLMLDMDAGRVTCEGAEIHLTVTEYRLLCELASPPDRVLSRSTLLDRVWDRGFFGDERIVDVHIRRLRTKVEEDAGDPQLVVTVRGLGYRLQTSG
jgi:DNA-binding response OmpR family regulator